MFSKSSLSIFLPTGTAFHESDTPEESMTACRPLGMDTRLDTWATVNCCCRAGLCVAATVITACRTLESVLSAAATNTSCVVPEGPCMADGMSQSGTLRICHSTSEATVRLPALPAVPASMRAESERTMRCSVCPSVNVMVSPQADTWLMAKLATVPSL